MFDRRSSWCVVGVLLFILAAAAVAPSMAAETGQATLVRYDEETGHGSGLLRLETVLREQPAPEAELAFDVERFAEASNALFVTVVRHAGECAPDSLESDGCARASILIGSLETRIQLVSYAAQRSLELSFATPTGRSRAAARRRTFASVSTERSREPKVSLVVSGSGAERVVATKAQLASRTYELSWNYPAATAGSAAPPTDVELWLPVVEALHYVLQEAGPAATPRIKTERVDEEPPPPVIVDEENVCSICDFCDALPGGHTLGGCFGLPGRPSPGGPGDGEPNLPPLPPPGPLPPPAPPAACTLSKSTVLRIVGEILAKDLRFNFCKKDPLFPTPFSLTFSLDRSFFVSRARRAADPLSRNCSVCFVGANATFDNGASTTIVEPRLRSIESILKPKCISTAAALRDPANATELSQVVDVATEYKINLEICKAQCDNPGRPAPHRGYCGCFIGYLDYTGTPPFPTFPDCPL